MGHIIDFLKIGYKTVVNIGVDEALSLVASKLLKSLFMAFALNGMIIFCLSVYIPNVSWWIWISISIYSVLIILLTLLTKIGQSLVLLLSPFLVSFLLTTIIHLFFMSLAWGWLVGMFAIFAVVIFIGMIFIA